MIKAARFLTTARLDDARALLADLEKRAPDTVEVKWLRGRARVPDRRLRRRDQAARQGPRRRGRRHGRRRRASSRSTTLAVTETFAEQKSPKGHFLIRYAPGPDGVYAARLAGTGCASCKGGGSVVEPTFEDEIRYRVKDHEVLLGFNDDEDAVDFVEWWYNKGVDDFKKYVARTLAVPGNVRLQLTCFQVLKARRSKSWSAKRLRFTIILGFDLEPVNKDLGDLPEEIRFEISGCLAHVTVGLASMGTAAGT